MSSRLLIWSASELLEPRGKYCWKAHQLQHSVGPGGSSIHPGLANMTCQLAFCQQLHDGFNVGHLHLLEVLSIQQRSCISFDCAVIRLIVRKLKTNASFIHYPPWCMTDA